MTSFLCPCIKRMRNDPPETLDLLKMIALNIGPLILKNSRIIFFSSCLKKKIDFWSVFCPSVDFSGGLGAFIALWKNAFLETDAIDLNGI